MDTDTTTRQTDGRQTHDGDTDAGRRYDGRDADDAPARRGRRREPAGDAGLEHRAIADSPIRRYARIADTPATPIRRSA